MTDELGLLNSLDLDIQKGLTSTTRSYREKPQIREEYHALIESPLLGVTYKSYPDIDSLRAEVAKAMPQLSMGKLYIFYGVQLPVYTDGNGANLFVVNSDGEELSLTDGYFTRRKINDASFGYQPVKADLDDLL
jgi:hypothetical protein